MREIPQSVKIWLKAASLETDINRKKNVLRKGAFSELSRTPGGNMGCGEQGPSDA